MYDWLVLIHIVGRAWYLVPAFALLLQGAIAGAAVYGPYAITRTPGAPVVLSAASRNPDWDFSHAMIRASHRAHQIAAALLIAAGSALLSGGE